MMLFIVGVVLSVWPVVICDPFKLKSCGNAIFKIPNETNFTHRPLCTSLFNLSKSLDATAPLDVSITQFPTPFRLKNNATFHISAAISLKQELPENIYVKISVARKIGFWFRIPCLGCDFGFDCKMFPQLCIIRDLCPNCSISAKNIKIRMPPNVEQEIPNYIPGFVIDGDYWLKLRLVDGTNHNKVIGCFEVFVTLDA